MKKIMLVMSLMVLSYAIQAQTKPVRIVFDITSKDTLTHQAVMRHVMGMAKSYPDSKFEVVIYGGAISMVTQGKSSVAEDIHKISNSHNVAFMVCGQTMKRYNVTDDQLVAGVKIVPDAILEIVNKQSEGWGYIKEAHN
jgi:intracellular sulfur oxidation DsrE/DsrF family protein